MLYDCFFFLKKRNSKESLFQGFPKSTIHNCGKRQANLYLYLLINNSVFTVYLYLYLYLIKRFVFFPWVTLFFVCMVPILSPLSACVDGFWRETNSDYKTRVSLLTSIRRGLLWFLEKRKEEKIRIKTSQLILNYLQRYERILRRRRLLMVSGGCRLGRGRRRYCALGPTRQWEEEQGDTN